jgi:hypothetical protein
LLNGILKIPNGRKWFQMTITYSNICHCKALQNLPLLGFSVWKFTIWQPWSQNAANADELRLSIRGLGVFV